MNKFLMIGVKLMLYQSSRVVTEVG